MSKQVKIARRNALRAIAGVSVALPLLQTLRGLSSASAQAASFPKRLIVYATVNSGWPEQFWPTLPGSTPIPERPAESWYVSGFDPLDVTDFSFSPILKPLGAHRSKLIIAEGVDGFDGGHEGYQNYFTGFPSGSLGAGGPSLDHVLAKELNLANATKFANLQFGVKTYVDPKSEDGAGYRLSHYAAGMDAPAEDDPAKMFQRIFGDFTAPSAAPSAAPDPAVLRRASVLDSSAQQLLDLQKQLPLAEDRAKLEAHLESIRTVETLVGKTSGAGALASCGKPPVPSGSDITNIADSPDMAKAQLENMVLAMSCDLTRVATYQFFPEGCGYGHPWLGITAGHHNDLGHGDPNDLNIQRQILKIETWHSEQVAALMDRLASIPEGAGTMLDNTIIVFVQTHTRGHAHSNMNSPLVIAGNLGGNALRQGRYVRFKRGTDMSEHNVGGEANTVLAPARTSSDLCFTIMKAFGLNPTTYGDRARFTGGINEILA